MNDLENNYITSAEETLLKDISSTGAKGAAIVISQMLGEKIDVKFPEIVMMNLDSVIGDEIPRDKLTSLVFAKFHGDLNGTAALFFSNESTLDILHALYNRDVESLETLEEIDYSIIKEMGNIIIGSFLNAFCNRFNLMVLPTVPDVAVDSVDAITDSFSLMLYNDGKEKLISVKAELIASPNTEMIFGVMLLLFNSAEDLDALLKENE